MVGLVLRGGCDEDIGVRWGACLDILMYTPAVHLPSIVEDAAHIPRDQKPCGVEASNRLMCGLETVSRAAGFGCICRQRVRARLCFEACADVGIRVTGGSGRPCITAGLLGRHQIPVLSAGVLLCRRIRRYTEMDERLNSPGRWIHAIEGGCVEL